MTRFLLLLLASAALGAAADADRAFYRPYDTRPNGKTIGYTVKPGETLFDIADKVMGDPYQAEGLAKRNGIRDPLHLEAGSRIEVPVPRLAIRYSIQKLVTGEGQESRYDVAAVSGAPRLPAGARFQIWLAANCDGYLYILNRDAQGKVNRLFPSGDRRNARVRRFSEYLVPRDGWFRMDKARGKEELWVLVSLEPLSDLEGALVASGVVESYFDGKKAMEGKGIEIDGGDETGGSMVVEGPLEGGLILAHKIEIARIE
jgi:uncharacterized protein DUF4384/LysM domain-containing protein